MLDEKLNGIEIGIKSYNITVNSDMMGIGLVKPNYYEISLEAYIYDTANFDINFLTNNLRLVKEENVEEYTKFLSWCKEKHPEIVIKYEMTKDAK